jgi:dihydroorotate dehydrogenase
VEWEVLLEMLEKLGAPPVELNLSCPNVKKAKLPFSLKYSGKIIAKLPPVGYDSLLYGCLVLGVECFHLCNTLPSTRGGRSGKVLKPYSLRAVEGVRRRFGDELEIIGGGGVTCVEDVRDFLGAGADHVAVGSMLLNPFWWNRVPLMAKTLQGREFSGGGNFAKPQD